MKTAHFADEIERWITGDHVGLDVDTLVAHIASCDACSLEAQKQAALELDLERIAQAVTRCPDCQRITAHNICKYCGVSASVGGFEVERVLVKNAHGRMYVARAPDGSTVALKELAFVQAPNLDALDSFDREARILRTLAHPGIPRFVASFQAGEGASTRLYLAQEFIPGESLLSVLERRAFTEQEVLGVARQVLDILVYLQDLSPKVFHRDIKPANLILRPNGSIALVDFGSARDRGATVGSTLVGTFGYMPIEQLGGIVSETSDLYALGATMFHLLTRREPWTLLDPDVRKRFRVSPGVKKLIETLIALRPADRYATAREARAALDEVSRVTSIRRRATYAKRSVAVALAVAGVAAGIGLGAMMHGLTPKARPQVVAPAPPAPSIASVPPAAWAPPAAWTPSAASLAPEDRDELDTFIVALWEARRVRVAKMLEQDAREARDRVDRDHGHILFGQIVVDGGGKDPRKVASSMTVLEEGYFVTAVADLQAPLELRLAGHEPKNVELTGLPPQAVIGLDVIHLTPLRAEQTATVRGRLRLEGAGLPSGATVQLWFRVGSNSPTEAFSPTSDARGEPVELNVDASGHFTMPMLVPTDYTLMVTSEGLASVQRQFSLAEGKKLDLGTITLAPSKTLELSYKASPNPDFTDMDAESASQLTGVDAQWETPGQSDWMNFEQDGANVSFDCRSCEIIDFGASAIARFTRLRPETFTFSHAPMRMNAGHVYLVKRPGEWLLFRVDSVSQE